MTNDTKDMPPSLLQPTHPPPGPTLLPSNGPATPAETAQVSSLKQGSVLRLET